MGEFFMNKYLVGCCILLTPMAMHGALQVPNKKIFDQQVEVVASVCYENKDLSTHQKNCARAVLNQLYAYADPVVKRLQSKDALKNKDKELLQDLVAHKYQETINRINYVAEYDKLRFEYEEQQQRASSFGFKLMLSSVASIVVYTLFLG
jgi:hypothetical protein